MRSIHLSDLALVGISTSTSLSRTLASTALLHRGLTLSHLRLMRQVHLRVGLRRADSLFPFALVQFRIRVKVEPSDDGSQFLVCRNVSVPFEEPLQIRKIDVAVIEVIDALEPILRSEIITQTNLLLQFLDSVLHVNLSDEEATDVRLDRPGEMVLRSHIVIWPLSHVCSQLSVITREAEGQPLSVVESIILVTVKELDQIVALSLCVLSIAVVMEEGQDVDA